MNLLEGFELAGDHREQVRHVILRLLPMPLAAVAGQVLLTLQRTVREHKALRRRGGDDLARQPIRRRIDAGVPIAGVFRLALRPDHPQAPRFALPRLRQ